MTREQEKRRILELTQDLQPWPTLHDLIRDGLVKYDEDGWVITLKGVAYGEGAKSKLEACARMLMLGCVIKDRFRVENPEGGYLQMDALDVRH